MSSPTYIFLPVEGSRITAEEAKIIGQVVSDLAKSHPDGCWSPADLVSAFKKPPARAVFLRHRRRMAAELDAAVANYLRRNVEAIEVRVERGVEIRSEPMPIAKVYSFASDEMEEARDNQAFFIADVKSSPDLMAREAARLESRMRSLVSDFLNLGGDRVRVVGICEDLLRELTSEPAVQVVEGG